MLMTSHIMPLVIWVLFVLIVGCGSGDGLQPVATHIHGWSRMGIRTVARECQSLEMYYGSIQFTTTTIKVH